MNSVDTYQAMPLVDPEVCKAKFNEELELFHQGRETQRKRGIILLEALFPNIMIAFSAPQLNPSPIVFAVRINFDNYDLEPPSIVFINPFTFEAVRADQIRTPFLRKIPSSPQPQPLLQQDADKPPFICLPGVREYHNHPAHTGDSWLLHRKNGGEGSLGYLVEKLYQYGITCFTTYQVPAMNINGLPFAFDPNQISE